MGGTVTGVGSGNGPVTGVGSGNGPGGPVIGVGSGNGPGGQAGSEFEQQIVVILFIVFL